MTRILFLIIALMVVSSSSFGQNDSIPSNLDSLNQEEAYEHIPKRSAMWAFAPGIGQLYNEIGYRKYAGKKNRAWWKIPIVWGALGACGYYWYDNFSNARLLKEEILYRREFGDSVVGNPDLSGYSTENAMINGYQEIVITETDTFTVEHKGFDLRARRRDIFLFATIGVFALQMIEAYVDGHFVSFDVTQDLSMRWYPKTFDSRSIGLGLNFTFKAPRSALAQKDFNKGF